MLNFRHLLERHQLGTALFATINAHLARQGLQVREGTIVDSTIISAPSSTKNRERARDLEFSPIEVDREIGDEGQARAKDPAKPPRLELLEQLSKVPKFRGCSRWERLPLQRAVPT